jgi:hypothetical protein
MKEREKKATEINLNINHRWNDIKTDFVLNE